MDQTSTRLRDAKLGSAIEDACLQLPDDCIIRIALSIGGVAVTLDVDGMETDFWVPGQLHEVIRGALEFAIDTAPGTS